MQMVVMLRDSMRKVAWAERRIWLIQTLMWPLLVLAGVTALGAAILFLRSRTPSDGRHELPETPGNHRVDAEGAADG